MDEESLLRELRALHPGRGVRRPQVTTWLGPNLQRMLDIDPDTPDEVARTRLIALINAQTEHFPRDLRYLFRLATGVTADNPFLEERLESAGHTLDRSQRVLRRRLREAEQLLAAGLATSPTSPDDPYDMKGWEWVDQDYRLFLSARTEVIVTRTVRAMTDGISAVREMIAFPEPVDDLAVGFDAVAGCRLSEVVREGPSRWAVTLTLPRTLRRGETQETTITVRLPHPKVLSPYLAVAPLRASTRIAMTVDFGKPPLASSAWVLDGVVTSVVGSYTTGQVTYDPTVSRLVSVEFRHPRPGLAYGIAWTWSPHANALPTPAASAAPAPGSDRRARPQ